MKKHYFRLLVLILSLFFTIFIVPAAAQSAQEEVNVTVNNQKIVFSSPPIMKNGRIFVPVRDICEVMGAQVRWDGSSKSITITRRSNSAVLGIGAEIAVINGSNTLLDSPPYVHNGVTLVPVRAIESILGVSLQWIGTIRTVNIYDSSLPRLVTTGITKDVILELDIGRYVGQVKDGKFDGRGIMTWKDGASYDGQWKEGTYHGQGTYTYANGDVFKGQFKYGKKEGSGTYTYKNGQSVSGLWANDSFKAN